MQKNKSIPKLQDLLVDPDKLETYSPPKHKKTVNHRLWPQVSGPASVEVIHGFLDYGGEAEPHFHAKSDQMLYILSGVMEMIGTQDSVEMHPGQFIFVPKGLEHQLIVKSPEGVNCLVMYIPALVDDINPAKIFKS